MLGLRTRHFTILNSHDVASGDVCLVELVVKVLGWYDCTVAQLCIKRRVSRPSSLQLHGELALQRAIPF